MHNTRKRQHHRRAFMLLVVIVFIALATTLVLLTAAGTAQLARSARSEHTSILLRQMIDSGIAWAQTHPGATSNAVTQSATAESIRLDAEGLLPTSGTGEIRISFIDGASLSADALPTAIIEASFDRFGRRHHRAVEVTIRQVRD